MPSIVLVLITASLVILAAPIYLAVLAGTLFSFEWLGPAMSSRVVPQRMVEGVNVFALLAVPLFIFAADIIARGQIGNRLVSLMEGLVGHLRGGLGIATVLACALFGAISGVGTAAIVSIGPIVYPVLLRAGYERGFAVGLILTASTLSMLLPPSVAMILYSVQTSTSVMSVFLAGLASGLVYIVFISAWCYFYAWRKQLPVQPRVSIRENLRRLYDARWALGLPVLVFGGIYSGVFTPTEAAAAACFYAMLVEVGIYRQLSVRALFQVSRASGLMSATLLILISVGALMAWFLTLEQVPVRIAAVLADVPAGAVLAVINVLFLVIGMVIDPNSALIILAPLVAPTAAAIGLDMVHLGALLVFNLSVGMLTPPFGLNIFIGMATFRLPYTEVLRSVLPFIARDIFVLLLFTYIPILVMWLPNLLR